MFLGMQKTGLGAISGAEEKKKFLDAIQIEKQRIQTRMLKGVYDSAFELYKTGDFERAQELAEKILSIDPNFQDATLLLQASGQVKGSKQPFLTERTMIEDRFQQGLELYKEGRLVEAARKWEEVVKLSPGNLKAQYWLKKTNRERSDEYFAKGEELYAARNIKDALEQWYNALLLNPNDPKLIAIISKADAELNEEEANLNLQLALERYEQGKLSEALQTLTKVLEIHPGDLKAQKLVNEVKFDIASKHIDQGRKYYNSRQYLAALDEWHQAQKYGYDGRYVAQLVDRTNQQMALEKEYEKRRADQKAQEAKEEEERKKREQEAAAQMEQEKTKLMEGSLMDDKSTKNLPNPETTEENKKAAQQHYMQGLVHFQNGNLEKARDEWKIALQFDPGYSEADLGLKKIDQLTGGQ